MQRRSRDPESRYREMLRRAQETLEEFAAHEIEWANDLLLWYRVKQMDIPDDEYRGVAYFLNREFLGKPDALTLLHTLYEDYEKKSQMVTKENAFDLVARRYKLYGMALEKGGY
ncbi:hypothetical protein AGMMS49587_15150 [Spirochaetia bacterium]|nr:hypothetical protein AGMMS49587_15150 [Spirochaetia bacterium]